MAAVGTLQDASRDEIQLIVEEAFKGVDPGDTLPVRNQPVLVGADCSLHFDPGGPGFYYPEGQRVLMLLAQDDTTGLWHPEYWGDAWFEVEGEGLAWFRGDDPWPSLSDLRTEVSALPPSAPLPDGEIACDVLYRPLTAGLDEMLARSELVVVGEFWGSTVARTKVRVHEYLKGSGPEDIEVLNRPVRPALVDPTEDDPGRCVADLGEQVEYFPAGRLGVLFLTRDEFGIAEWRPAMLGLGAFILSDEQLNSVPGLPTLTEVRAEAERVTGQPSRRAAVAPQPTAAAAQEPDEVQRDDAPFLGERPGNWIFAIGSLILTFLLGAGVGIAGSRRRARRGRGG